MNSKWKHAVAGALAVSVLAIQAAAQREPRGPNFIIVFADDLGYADLGRFGEPEYPTPNLDRLSDEGMRLTHFYVAQAVCSASRAALLTGCYPNRIGIRGALDHRAQRGIDASEWTLAEVLKQRGYATAIFGKWHLGHRPEYLPTRHGFDEYFGLPYSNDMWPHHPTNKDYYPDLPLIEAGEVVALDPDQSQLTTWYTERALSFIERNAARPFFLYLAHTMPHVPLFVSEKFKGKTPGGLYGDVISEIDWSMGEILATLRRLNLEEDTVIVFTSDNGPWLSYGDHAGSAGPLRAGKGTTFEGGVRVPFIIRWPGRIPPGSESATPAMTIDILPTFAALAGAELPKDRVIDGRDIGNLLQGKASNPADDRAFYFYWVNELQAVRQGRWKLHLPHSWQEVVEPGGGGAPGRSVRKEIGLELFDLETDVGEAVNVAEGNPDVVQRLMREVEKAREDLGDSLVDRHGRNVRR